MSAGPAPFPATQWSVVLSAREDNSRGREALETLLRAYWPPLLAYLRAEGHAPDTAQDLLQGFLTRLLAREDLRQVGPEQGRFRSYLLAGLRHYLISERRRQFAAKRGAGTLLPWDDEQVARELHRLPAPEATPETEYDRRWACTILERALARLQSEHRAQARSELFETLRPTLVGDGEENYATLAARLGLSAGTVAVTVHRLRRRLRDLVRDEVRETVGSAADLEAELRHLLAAWSG